MGLWCSSIQGKITEAHKNYTLKRDLNIPLTATECQWVISLLSQVENEERPIFFNPYDKILGAERRRTAKTDDLIHLWLEELKLTEVDEGAFDAISSHLQRARVRRQRRHDLEQAALIH